MIYKFNGDNTTLEVQENSFKTVMITIEDYDCNMFSIELSSPQLYDLIGCLHSLKGKLDKYEKEGKNG